jgi:hypothetical protein
MLGWWVEQPPYLRTTLALVPLAVGVGCFLLGAWRAGICLTAVGAVLLAISFPSRSEMKGYHD